MGAHSERHQYDELPELDSSGHNFTQLWWSLAALEALSYGLHCPQTLLERYVIHSHRSKCVMDPFYMYVPSFFNL